MLPKKHRLMLRHFPDFFVKSKKTHSPLFTLFTLAIESDFAQGAVVVPKKNVAKSSARNLAKRQVSELLYPLLKNKHNFAVMVLVKKTLSSADLLSLKSQLQTTLNQV